MSREKQIEEMAEHLIEIQQNFNEYCAKPCRECELGGVVNCENHYKAEQLYNAGYRKQEWISVSERLPESSCECLVATNIGGIYQVYYSHRYKAFNALDTDEAKYAMLTVTHWMPLPEPPKGE